MYKVNDVKMQQFHGSNSNGEHQCASERLHAKLKRQQQQLDDTSESNNVESLSDTNSDSDATDAARTSDTLVTTFLASSKDSGKSDIFNYYKVLLGDNRIKLNRKKRRKRWLNDEVRILLFLVYYITTS